MSSLNEKLTPAQLRKQRDAVLDIEDAKQQQIRDEKYIAEAERYKQYVGVTNAAPKEVLWELRFVLKSPYFYLLILVTLFEKYLLVNIVDIYSHSKFLHASLDVFHHLMPATDLTKPLMYKGYSEKTDAYLFYLYTMKVIVLLKIGCVFMWLNSVRQTRLYRTFTITPLTVVKPLSASEDIMEPIYTDLNKPMRLTTKYRSVFSRWVWLFFICLLGLISLWATILSTYVIFPSRLTFIYAFFIAIAIHGLLDTYRFIRINYLGGVSHVVA